MRATEAFPNVTVLHPWCRLAPDDTVLAFPVLQDEAGRPVSVSSITDRIPARFEGTFEQLDDAVAEWDFIAESMNLELGKVAVFPPDASDVEQAVIPFNAGDRLRELAIDGQDGRYAFVMNLP